MSEGYYAELEKIDDEIHAAYMEYIEIKTQLTNKFHDRINGIMGKHRDLVDFYLMTDPYTKEKTDE